MNHGGYVSANHLISLVLPIVRDTRQKDLAPGWYLSACQQAITELGFHTMFDQRIWTGLIPESLTVDMPNGLINIVHLWAFSGNTCNQNSRANIWHATGFFRENKAQFKEQAGTQWNDPIMDNTLTAPQVNEVLFYNTLGNKLMLSDACGAYEKVFMEYRGIGVDFGEAPVIPYYLMDAVKWWMAVEALQILALERQEVATDRALATAKDNLDGNRMKPGAWLTAKRRVQGSNRKEMEDTMKYLNKLSSVDM